jgi:hypothetical protein
MVKKNNPQYIFGIELPHTPFREVMIPNDKHSCSNNCGRQQVFPVLSEMDFLLKGKSKRKNDRKKIDQEVSIFHQR